MEDQHPELTAPIPSLPFSDAFKAMAKDQDFKTLGDILNWPVSVLLMHEGFTYHHYQELWHFMQDTKLIKELKQR